MVFAICLLAPCCHMLSPLMHSAYSSSELGFHCRYNKECRQNDEDIHLK